MTPHSPDPQLPDSHTHPAAESPSGVARPSWPRERSRDGGVDRIPLTGSGELWLCGKHAVGPDPERAMADIGATTIVCLTQEHELADRYPTYVRWLAEQQPLRAVWFPIPDLHAPGQDAIRLLLDQLSGRLGNGERLLVHCGAGIGRAGTLAVCLLIHLGAQPDEALRLVASHRPMAGPEVGAQRDLVDAIAASVSAEREVGQHERATKPALSPHSPSKPRS